MMEFIPPRAALSYLGSKSKLVGKFRRIFSEAWPDSNTLTFVDAFAGTGVVTQHVGSLFARSIVNDQEEYSRLVLTALFTKPVYAWTCKPDPVAGFITRTYCPRKSKRLSPSDRLYWSRSNGMRLDGFRDWAIENLQGVQRDYALGCMLIAADRCANTCGGYWGFRRHFRTASSRRPVVIEPIPTSDLDVTVQSEDATAVCLSAPRDAVIYMDPPYGTRSYGNNYFVLNVIGSAHDTAVVTDRKQPGGITGMPADRIFQKSAWNTTAALEELKKILSGTPARRIALSYSDDPTNSMAIEDIKAAFADRGWEVEAHEIRHMRYASQNPSGLGSAVTELLFVGNRI